MKPLKKFGVILLGIAGLVLAGCGNTDAGMSIDQIKVGNQKLGVSVHDPSIVKANEKYYIFGSHMEVAVSDDLTSFKSIHSGVNAQNKLFDNLFTGDMDAFSYTGKFTDGGYAVWAPDVIYNKAMGKWVMYVSTSHDYRTSTICMATADSIEGPYSYQETLVYSGFTAMTAEQTNFYDVMGKDADVKKYLSGGAYDNLKYPNCIDPTIFYDKDGKMWMVYGSWSGGIWILEIDETTGLPIHPVADEEKHTDTYFGQYLIGGLHNSCEGPYIIYNEESGYYYLLVSYGGLTREGGYQIRQFRSENVTGPYIDAKGETFGYVMDQTGYGVKMMGNYSFPSLKTAYMAPGHCSAFQDDDGRIYMVHHTRFNTGSEYHEPRVRRMFINEDGWLVAAPFATEGAELDGQVYKNSNEISGVYYCVNHQLDISSEIHEASAYELKQDGTIVTADGIEGKYEVKPSSNQITITMSEVVYKGVIAESIDEAGNPICYFTTVGNNNECLWGVFYKKE